MVCSVRVRTGWYGHMGDNAIARDVNLDVILLELKPRGSMSQNATVRVGAYECFYSTTAVMPETSARPIATSEPGAANELSAPLEASPDDPLEDCDPSALAVEDPVESEVGMVVTAVSTLDVCLPPIGLVALSFVSMYAVESGSPKQEMIGSILNAGWCAKASGRM